jgi:hypothetical protein
VKLKPRGSGANGLGESDDLLDRFALHVQRDQQRRNLRVAALSSENLAHYSMRFRARKRLAVVGEAMERVEDHLWNSKLQHP